MRMVICCFGSRNTPKAKLVDGYILKIPATKLSCVVQLKPGHGNQTLGMKLSWYVCCVLFNFINLKTFEISGGTGITPFVQLFHNVISQPTKSPNTRFTLIHSSRVPAELPPPAVLEPLTAFAAKNSETFKVHVFVDVQDGSNFPMPIRHINTGRITDSALERCLRSEQMPGSWWRKLFHKNVSEDERPRRTLFLVCGPES